MFRGKNTKRQKQIYLLNNTFLCYVRVKSSLRTILFSNIIESRHLNNIDIKNNKMKEELLLCRTKVVVEYV